MHGLPTTAALSGLFFKGLKAALAAERSVC